MLPSKVKLGFLLGIILLCSGSEIVTARRLRGRLNALRDNPISCYTCDSKGACASTEGSLLQKCASANDKCVIAFDEEGAITQRGCGASVTSEFKSYCTRNPEKCRQCRSSECNEAPLIEQYDETYENRHSCYQCEDDCSNPEPKVCQVVQENDKCFMLFDESLSVVRMGCASDYENGEIPLNLLKEKLIWVCDDENCNGYENMPSANDCTKCSSATDEACATNPATVVAEKKCKIIPYTECYERVINETGVTERGCLSDLDDDDFYDCLMNGGQNCRTCQQDNCNSQVFPEDRLQCQRCKSDDDYACEKSPSALSVCPTLVDNDACISVYENGVTVRGCQSEVQCDASSKNCDICKSDGCNTVNVKRRMDDIFGLFQDLPLNCNTCENEDCLTGLKNAQKCDGDPYQDCVTVFDESGSVIRRGCQLLVEADYSYYCEANPQLCFNCKSNGCNDVQDATAFQECLYCDSSNDKDCLFNPEAVTTKRKCVEGCVATLYKRKDNPTVYDFARTCFEDIESDDRDACTAENNCEKCTDGNECNTSVLPVEGRLSCFHCDGDDCTDPQKEDCQRYAENDQCFIYFDETTHVAASMGCKSDLSEEILTTRVKDLFLCDGNDCNAASQLSEPTVCSVCDSLDDENCAADPSLITATKTCSIQPNTDCYTRLNDDGSTQRGCLYDLPTDEFVACHSGSPDANCKVCIADNCNKGVYPSSRQKCYRCNSSDDADCTANPQTSQACPLYVEDDSCVTKLVDQITYRGCGSEMNCDGMEKKYCKTCTTSNCNVDDLTVTGIGDPGKFQGLPLNCYQCEGEEECGGSSLGLINKCEGNNLQTCTTAFGADGAVVERGCSDSVQSTCNEADVTCYGCKSNGCNVATSEDDYIDCIFCDSDEESQCALDVASVTSTRKCHKSCMVTLYTRSTGAQPVYELLRSCLDDKDSDDMEKCESEDVTNCVACTSGNCNTETLGERISCYQCIGDDCQSPVTSTCSAVTENDQCFIQYDETGEVTELGCKSKYDPEEVKLLVTAKQMWLCEGDNCNTLDNLPTSQSCSICNSRTDPDCAISPESVSATTTCSKVPYTQCYSRILDGGYTERGCLSSLEGDTFYDCLNGDDPNECLICTGVWCNSALQPIDRRSCQVCDSISTGVCENNPQSLQVCLKYVENDSCVAYLDDNGNTVRGCSSAVTCDPTNGSTCEICHTDDCNRSNLKRKSDGKPGMWQEPPLSCYRCSSAEECQTLSTNQLCSSETEYCLTVFGEAGAVISRGCSATVESEHSEYCDINTDRCFNCNSNLCNIATAVSDYVECVYCDSESNANCVSAPDAVTWRRKCNQQCMTALHAKPDKPDSYHLVRSCLDDKDIEDRLVCQEEDNNHCKACNGAACNADQLPENRLSCYSCIGEGCEDPDTQFCEVYESDDECYVWFDDKNDIRQMGCISDLDASVVQQNRYMMYTCNNDQNCNGFENLPTPKICVVCNSHKDELCATQPDQISDIAQCTNRPNTQCYTRVNSDGSTTRGCVSSLSASQIKSCLTGNATDCTICEKDRCNIQLYPSDRRSCHRCNTVDDPTCESSPDASSVCPLYDAEEFCSVKIVDGQTYRGCSSEFQCDPSDKQYCRLCYDADNCNTADLASISIGYPGKWQSLPISCYACEGEECQGESQGVSAVCDGNDLQNCGSVFDATGAVVQRGCSDAIYEGDYSTYCDENPSSCRFCKSNDCNTAVSLTDYLDCVFCDSSEDKNCTSNVEAITRTRKCHKKCMTGLYPLTSDDNPTYVLSRGCLDDMDAEDQVACENGENPLCKACDEALCNKDDIEVERQSCYVCIGEDCDDPVSQECTSYQENDQCFILFIDNDIQRMGCASDLDSSFLEENKRGLLFCDPDNCNFFDILPNSVSCRVCNSSDEEVCAIDPSLISLATVCSDLPYTQCYTLVDQDGATRRGCLSDVSDEEFDECVGSDNSQCQICDSNNCNMDLYPAIRRSCHRCNSKDEAACEESPQQYAGICPIYDAEDGCVTKLEDGYLYRGCTTDFTCDTSDRDSCRICSTDNCNTINLLGDSIGDPGKWQGLPLNCYTCEGDECTSSSSSGVVHKCEGNNLQTCVTVFDATGAVEKRGCSDSVMETHGDYCDENSESCIGCKSNGCNTATSLNDFTECYFCDSAQSNECSINFDTTTAKTRKCLTGCMVALYPRSSAEEPAYELSRSCLDDKDLDDQEECEEGKDEFCQACTGARCNTMSIPATRHSCYKCVGDDCQTVETQECSAYVENDQCYFIFDEENSIAAMGCRSEFEVEAIDELVKQKRAILCEGENCNALDNIPTPKTCSVCNSLLDPQCATNPNLVANTERCASLPYTECFTRINEAGHTERGCLSELEDEQFYACLKGTDDLCETCTGDKCNELDVFPENRWKCHQCNSADDSSCSSEPDSNTVCPVYEENDKCVTNLRNGVTYRGCASNMECDDASNKRTCRICDTPGCNTVDLEKVSEQGEPGIWQDIPITCYTCVGETDCESLGDLRVCTNNPYQNCMTVYDEDGKVSQRGCSDTVEEANADYCSSNPQKCLACNSNGCNKATSLDDYVECIACDSTTNSACVNDVSAVAKTRLCHKTCMTALYPLFNEENPAYALSRSCFDDMDEDDREACENGNKEYCEICNESKCNTVAVPSTRLSCNTCTDDDCQDLKASECAAYRPDDKCYIQFDEQRSIVGMGCRSEFTNEDATYLLMQKRLFLCDEDNCNTFDALPSSQSCVLCNSLTDTNCAVDPQSVASTTSCSIQPYTECYARVLESGATERGCLSSLVGEEFLGCQNGTSSTCLACAGEKCNNELYPDDRLSCHICDSSVSSECEASPNSISVCPSYASDDTCVTKYENDVTYRGCNSNLECDGSDSKSCVKCSGNGCNTVNLAKRQDDNFGKWQDLPLSCLTCVGSDCDSEESVEVVTCTDNNEQDCVTVFGEDGTVVRRGCSDAVEQDYGEYCDENEDACYNCKSNECNTASAASEFIECIYCDSYKRSDCLFNVTSGSHKTRKCQGACMTALYPSDSSDNPGYELIRTCLNDKDESDQEICSGGTDKLCKACTTANCNTDEIPDDRLQCNVCDDEDCEEGIPEFCAIYKEDDKCYTWFDDTNSITELGCLSAFRNQDLEAIIKTKKVYVCNGSNCNSMENVPAPTKCAVCDSNDDPACAVNAFEIGTFETCSRLPYTECYTKLETDGSTMRGCLYDLAADSFAQCLLGTDEKCDICSEDGCNREIFPADRQQCYTCSSEDDEDCESFPTETRPCSFVSDSETCKTALNVNVTIRGCSSVVFCDDSDWTTCRSCSGTGCNSIDLVQLEDDKYHGAWQDLPLTCHTCGGEDCLTSLGPGVACSRNIEQDCMTVFEANGDVRRRGCSDDVEDYEDLHCRQNPGLCFRCKSNECNVAWQLTDYIECDFCNSTTDANCAIDPENGDFPSRSCYKECIVAIKGSELIRSCLDDKEVMVQHECRSGEDGNVCASCEDNNCNKFIYPTNRHKCHVCVGSDCSSSQSQYCQNYDENDFCFAKYENGKVDLMGCGSSLTSEDLEDWTAQKKLFRCEGSECNDLKNVPTSSTCLSCDSSKTPNCAQDASQVDSTETCSAPYNECVTRLNEDGDTLRGCLNKLDDAEQSSCIADGTCAACTGDKCNSQVFPTNRRKCHICSSLDDTSCTKSPNALKVCLTYDAKDQCVSKKSGDTVNRDCASKLSCNPDTENCSICDTDGCNTQEYSGSAAVGISNLLLTITLAVLMALALNRH